MSPSSTTAEMTNLGYAPNASFTTPDMTSYSLTRMLPKKSSKMCFASMRLSESSMRITIVSFFKLMTT